MRLVQVAQHAEDLERASAFYRQLLGTEPTGLFDPPGLLFFDLDGVRLLLEPGAASVSLAYLAVPSVRDAIPSGCVRRRDRRRAARDLPPRRRPRSDRPEARRVAGVHPATPKGTRSAW